MSLQGITNTSQISTHFIWFFWDLSYSFLGIWHCRWDMLSFQHVATDLIHESSFYWSYRHDFSILPHPSTKPTGNPFAPVGNALLSPHQNGRFPDMSLYRNGGETNLWIFVVPRSAFPRNQHPSALLCPCPVTSADGQNILVDIASAAWNSTMSSCTTWKVQTWSNMKSGQAVGLQCLHNVYNCFYIFCTWTQLVHHRVHTTAHGYDNQLSSYGALISAFLCCSCR